ncbi:MAG: hypothetical protein ACK5WD_14100 [bacterium]
MRCKQCESILWQQPAAPDGGERRCSECGEPYRTTDFQFVPGKVRFECPHCATGYYGTSPTGHLEPPIFRCVTCEKVISMDDCILRPEGVANESDAERRLLIPWLDHGNILARWFSTTVVGVDSPQSIASRLSGQPRYFKAFGFLFTQVVVSVSPYLCCCGFAWGLMLIPAGGGPGGGIFLGTAAATVFLSTLFAIVASLLAVLFARMVSPIGSPSFGRDVETVCYSSGPLALSVVPVLGNIGVIWWFVAAAVALAGGRPPGGRALVGVAAAAGFILPSIAAIVLFVYWG